MSENIKQELDDYNNEIAGRDTGRIKRFLSQEARDHLEGGKKDKSQEKLSLLDILLMTDPVYAQLYSDVMEKIEKIDQAVSKALANSEKRIDTLKENLADIRGRAERLADGTLVYRSKDGAVFSDDGILISQQEMVDVEWKSSNPSWEERREAGEALDSAYKKKEEIEEYRDGALQHAKDRMNDRENPPDKDEMKDLYDSITDILPDDVKANMDNSNDKPTQSDFMKSFNSKASGQEEMPDNQDSINLPIAQETELSQNPSSMAP